MFCVNELLGKHLKTELIANVVFSGIIMPIPLLNRTPQLDKQISWQPLLWHFLAGRRYQCLFTGVSERGRREDVALKRAILHFHLINNF